MTAIRYATSIVLGLVAATSASAFAAEPEAAPAASTTATTATMAVTTAVGGVVTVRAGKAALAYKDAANARFCFRAESMTGTRLSRTRCNTRANWEAAGVDLDAALAGH